jgi:hypothetical protein
MSKKLSIDEFYNSWGEMTTPAMKKNAEQTQKSILKGQSSTGKSGGRGSQGGRGNQSGGRGGNNSESLQDPWAGEKLEKPIFSEGTEALVRELLQRTSDRKIVEEDTENLKPRERMQVLMVLFADKGKDYYTSGSRTQLAHRIRYKSESWVRDMINDSEALEKEVSLLDIAPENKSLFNSWTAPLDFVDLVGEEAWLEFARAKSPHDKREAIMVILKKYFMRNFEMDEKLMDLYNEIEGLSVDYLVSLLKIRGVLPLEIHLEEGQRGPTIHPS